MIVVLLKESTGEVFVGELEPKPIRPRKAPRSVPKPQRVNEWAALVAELVAANHHDLWGTSSGGPG